MNIFFIKIPLGLRTARNSDWLVASVEKIIERETEQQTDGEKYGITKQAISELSTLKDAFVPRKGQPKRTAQERAADKKRFQETLQDSDKYFKGFVLPTVKGEALDFPGFYEKFKAAILVQHAPGTRASKLAIHYSPLLTIP